MYLFLLYFILFYHIYFYLLCFFIHPNWPSDSKLQLAFAEIDFHSFVSPESQQKLEERKLLSLDGKYISLLQPKTRQRDREAKQNKDGR